MHPCHEASHYEPWAERLVGWGYVTLQFTRCQEPNGEPLDAEHNVARRHMALGPGIPTSVLVFRCNRHTKL